MTIHVRLKVRRWGTLPVRMLQGGWYPAEPVSDHGVRARVDGHPVALSKAVLDVITEPRVTAVWACDVDDQKAFVVCPEGHHIRKGVAPQKPRAWCERCKREYEIET